MDPAVDADLVALGDDAALLVRVDQRGDRRHVERRLDAVAVEQFQDARHADPGAELAPGEPADRLAAVAQIAGLVIAVERQRDRAARAARPFARPQRPAGAHPVDQLAPVLLRPLPGFEIGFRSVHGRLVARAGSREGGRSGEIRTLDPQHPILILKVYRRLTASDCNLSPAHKP